MSVIEHWPERIALQTTERGRPMPGLFRSLWPDVPPLQDGEVEYVRADLHRGAVDVVRELRAIIVRPVGEMSAEEYAKRLFAAVARADALLGGQ